MRSERYFACNYIIITNNTVRRHNFTKNKKNMSIESSSIPVTIEFGGGAELLFDKKKKHSVNLPGNEWTIQKLLFWIKDNLLKERPELFMQGDTVRPGILVLVNDTDWELLGESNYKINSGDTILFISTLHGG